ncbi:MULTISPECIES: GNAT family N-acetyltransferase [Pseudoalteromonas]|uniref:Sortase related acyltransferase n=1 Tax=Pseudoalteromonas luteoviolacea (strain 2ta16) TaxID=1353533 RepID=V4JEG4_PSEL2|nr:MULTISPECIES: GNAT family N-acetyltransferase [Pseudoalteromonas]ESP93417.1 sortase related acyltransferase [Pseudoalteromonas luteoviolacea 2ta16]KZN43892.1 hypothetical protein N483_08200 [Pseudoalteromonas luteoviolacea NCIMB 1944]MCG7549169.1 GNAT family N-acetyltransferase [Pseudoalteromonas sp. Of7M-16]
MHIRAFQKSDLNTVSQLVSEVSKCDILPHFCEQGQTEFINRVIPDLEATLNQSIFNTFIAIHEDRVVGFAAIRERNYITHLFVDKGQQGSGIGKVLLDKLLSYAKGKQVSLRSSLNARSFYEKQGFTETEPEGQFNGIRFVPMSITINQA